jgi:hypothetical protein
LGFEKVQFFLLIGYVGVILFYFIFQLKAHFWEASEREVLSSIMYLLRGGKVVRKRYIEV